MKLIKSNLMWLVGYLWLLVLTKSLQIMCSGTENGVFTEIVNILIFCVVYLYFPIISIFYGIKSYKETKMTFFAGIILFFVLGIALVVLSLFINLFGLEFGGEQLLDKIYTAMYGSFILTIVFSIPIAAITAIISAFVTKFVLKKALAKSEKPSEKTGTPTEPTENNNFF